MNALKAVAASPNESVLSVTDLVEDFLGSCRARGLAFSTVEQVYGYALKHMFLPWCAIKGVDSIGELDQRTVDGFTSHLLTTTTRRGKRLSRESVHMYVRTVRQFLKWCEEAGEGSSGRPQLPRRPRRVIDTLSREEIDQLEGAAHTDRDRLIVRLMADTGIRVGELCSLGVGDLSTQDRRPLLKVHGKGDKDRLVPVAPALARRLQRHIAGRPNDVNRAELFLSRRRDSNGDCLPITRSGILQLLRNLARQAGIKKLPQTVPRKQWSLVKPLPECRLCVHSEAVLG